MCSDVTARLITRRPLRFEYDLGVRFAKARGWLQNCVEHHDCGSTSGFVPAYLIPIDGHPACPNLRLIPGRNLRAASPRYAALSYCWEEQQKYVLSSSTLQSWLLFVAYDKLPKTIKDAIVVSCELGLQHIWCDALCIVQDSDENKMREIPKVGEIYENAYVTTTASKAKSVDEGFLGWSKLEIFRVACEVSAGEIGSILLSPRLRQSTSTEIEPLNRRGWALQERLLSSRRLDFSTPQTRWTCMENKRTRTPVVDTWDDFMAVSPYRGGDETWELPERQSWSQIVQVYTTRQLSDPRDNYRLYRPCETICGTAQW